MNEATFDQIVNHVIVTTNLKSKGIDLMWVYKTLSVMIAEWSTLNVEGRRGFLYEAVDALLTDKCYQIPSDITVTGKPYWIERLGA